MSAPGDWRANPKYAWCAIARHEVPLDGAALAPAELAAEVRAQASRCIQCPDAVCTHACPLHNRIPEWLELAADGRFLEAAAVSRETSSMPEICARTCAQGRRLCEEACLLGGHSDPVAIALVEQFINDFALAEAAPEAAPAMPNGFTVAVVGSGPGALTCADHLAATGYDVTVFEATEEPGAPLLRGFGTFKLSRDVVHRRVRLLVDRGVKFCIGVEMGRELSLDLLREDFDAIFLSFGRQSAKPQTLPPFETSSAVSALPGVFIGGDAVDDPSLLVHAVRDGRAAALGIDRYLQARTEG